jgi:hypothetical protein
MHVNDPLSVLCQHCIDLIGRLVEEVGPSGRHAREFSGGLDLRGGNTTTQQPERKKRERCDDWDSVPTMPQRHGWLLLSILARILAHSVSHKSAKAQPPFRRYHRR